MNSKDYVKEILDRLMKKYQNRAPRREGMKSRRRVILKPSALYRHYADNNADISVKQEIHEAVDKLLDMGMVTADYLKFSTDIEKISLCEEKAEEAATTKDCPYCCTSIPVNATRCPNCTSELKP